MSIYRKTNSSTYSIFRQRLPPYTIKIIFVMVPNLSFVKHINCGKLLNTFFLARQKAEIYYKNDNISKNVYRKDP